MQFDHLRRREFITLLGGAAAWPLAARAQQTAGKVVSIGILVNEAWPPIDTFRQTLNELGYVEGKNLRFEHRYAEGGTEATLAAKQATTTVPIVMGAVGDPIGSGVVTNLARPAANITGFSSLAAELEAKRLELLKETIPGLSRVAIFFNPTNRYMPLALESTRRGAEILHAALTLYGVSDNTALDATFVKLTKDPPDAFMVLGTRSW